MLLMCGVCGGGALWFSSFPTVPPTAMQPFDIKAPAQPDAPKVGEEQIVNGARFREVIWGDGSGSGQRRVQMAACGFTCQRATRPPLHSLVSLSRELVQLCFRACS